MLRLIQFWLFEQRCHELYDRVKSMNLGPMTFIPGENSTSFQVSNSNENSFIVLRATLQQLLKTVDWNYVKGLAGKNSVEIRWMMSWGLKEFHWNNMKKPFHVMVVYKSGWQPLKRKKYSSDFFVGFNWIQSGPLVKMYFKWKQWASFKNVFYISFYRNCY